MQYRLDFDTAVPSTTATHRHRTLLVQDATGTVRAATPEAVLAVARELVQQTTHPGQPMTSTTAVHEFLQLRLNAAVQREIFGVLYLTSARHLIAYDEPFAGTINQASVFPREIVKAALLHNAAAVIIAHNHPSGNPEPSRADTTLTRTLADVLQVVDVQLVDHLIVAGDKVTSLAERGLMP